MAVRFSALGQHYTRTLSLGVQNAQTLAGWIYISTDRAFWSAGWTTSSSGTDFAYVGAPNAAGGGIVYQDNAVTSTTVAAAVGKWHFVAAVLNGASGTLYVRAADAAAWSTTTWSTGQATRTMTSLSVGSDDPPFAGSADWLNGRVSGVKLWTATLTQAELDAEFKQHVPIRTANLVAWYPLIAPETPDYSGNGQTLSGGAGATAEDGPPIPWDQVGYVPLLFWPGDGPNLPQRFVADPRAIGAVPAVGASNDFDGGGSGGATLTTANAGGSGDTQVDAVTIGSGAAVTLDSTHAHSGGLAVKCNTGASATDAGFEWSTAIGALSDWYTRVYYYATSNPTSHHRIFDAVTAGGAALCSGVMHHTDGTLLLLDGGFGIAAQTTSTISLNQYVRIETRFIGAAVGGYVELRLFNSPDSTTPTETISASSVNTSGAASIYRFGFNGDTYDANRSIWLDDVAVSNQGWLGPATVPPATSNAEAATAYATRFTDEFASLAPILWAESEVHGHWTVQPSGTQTVQPVDVSGTRYLGIASEAVGGGGGTFATLTTTVENFAGSSTLAVEYITDTQLRTVPNNWEVLWTLFNFSDSNHFYYVLLCPNGYWEVGKEWHNGVSQQQDFLAFGTAGVTWPLGDRLRVEVDQSVSGGSLTLTVRAKDITRGDSSYQNLVTGFVDDGTRPSGAAYTSGKIGLYSEDSAGRVALVELDSSQLMQASVAVTATPATATAAGAGLDATVAVTAPAGLASASGAGFDALAGVGPAPAAATGTGAGFDVAQTAITFTAEATTATGVAPDAQAGLGALAGLPAGAGAAFDIDHVDVTATPPTPTAAGTALDAAAAVTVGADFASGTAAAFDVVAALAAVADAAAAAGSAFDASAALAALADYATGTGSGFDGSVGLAALAEAAAVVGTAWDGLVGVGVNADPAAGTGTGFDGSTTGTVNVAAEAASGAGASFDAAVAITASADVASATATAPDAAADVTVPAETAISVGSAYDPAVSTSSSTSVPAEAATGVGAAYDATVDLTASAGVAAATGVAGDPVGSVGALPDTPAATGAGFDAGTAVTVNAEQAAATGAAPDPVAASAGNAGVASGSGSGFDATSQVAVNAENTAAAGAASDATVTTSTATNAAAEVATGVGVGYDAAVAVTAAAEAATAAGAGPDAAGSVGAPAEAATSGGSAPDPAAVVAATAGTASGTGTAFDTATAVTVNAATASATGAAFDATVTTSSQTSAPAEAATAAGVGFDATAAVAAAADVTVGNAAAYDAAVAATTATGTATTAGAAYDGGPSVGVQPDCPAGSGAAFDATVTGTSTASPTAGTGSGAAFDAAVLITVTAETTTTAGTAYPADVVAVGVEAGTRPGIYTPGNTRPRHAGGSTRPRLTAGRSRGPTYTSGGG